MTDLNSIRARLGSISDTSMSKLPKAVQTLLREDMPRLVEVAESCIELLSMNNIGKTVDTSLDWSGSDISAVIHICCRHQNSRLRKYRGENVKAPVSQGLGTQSELAD